MKVEAGKILKIRANRNSKFNRIMGVLGTFLIIAAVTYGFMALCYWNLNLQEWGGFGRFLLAAEGVVFLIKLFDEI